MVVVVIVVFSLVFIAATSIALPLPAVAAAAAVDAVLIFSPTTATHRTARMLAASTSPGLPYQCSSSSIDTLIATPPA